MSDIDEREIASRREFFGLTDGDLERLKSLRGFAESHLDEIIESFYEILQGHPSTRRFLADPGLVSRLKVTQKKYFLGLFEGRCDVEYVQDRLHVGKTHERVGLPSKWYLGAYAHYLRLVHERLVREIDGSEEVNKALASLTKLVFFDTALAMDRYIEAHLETLGRHRAAIRELSTPVIRVHDQVLLLPLVGTIDSHRAQQIMETVLSQIVEEQARVIILDIAGVPVVDTQVADHLLKTTAAIKLLGAATVLTGISAQVARTVVELGVEISTMHTRSRLADGLELALKMVGKEVVDIGGSEA
jgi:rsbT co-antagonist protein RsbR